MPYKTPTPEKNYFAIGEVAKMFGVNTSLIRFWEKEFSIIKPHKDSSGKRLFTKKDVDNFHVIYHLVKEEGLTLDGARKRIKSKPNEEFNNLKVAQSLAHIKDLLLGVKEGL